MRIGSGVHNIRKASLFLFSMSILWVSAMGGSKIQRRPYDTQSLCHLADALSSLVSQSYWREMALTLTMLSKDPNKHSAGGRAAGPGRAVGLSLHVHVHVSLSLSSG